MKSTISTRVGFAGCLSAALAIGCGGGDEIRTYRVATAEEPKTQPVAPATTPPAGDPTDRMVAAVVGSGDRVWFLKAVAPFAAISAIEADLIKMLGSLDASGADLRWKLPEAWTEQPGSGMRRATLLSSSGASEEPVEVTVIDLPRTGDWEPQLVDNVNRWRGQMGLEPLDARELPDSVEPLQEVGDEAVLVDLVGWFSGGMAPGRMAAGSRPASASQPSGVQPTSAPPTAELTYDTPAGWTIKAGSAMRKASFETPAGSEVTAFVFSAAAEGMADPLGNVNRWRAQNGLGPTTEEELAAAAETIDLSGEAGTYVELAGETEKTLAAMASKGGRVWFFKLRGPSDAADADRTAFRQWIESVRF